MINLQVRRKLRAAGAAVALLMGLMAMTASPAEAGRFWPYDPYTWCHVYYPGVYTWGQARTYNNVLPEIDYRAATTFNGWKDHVPPGESCARTNGYAAEASSFYYLKFPNGWAVCSGAYSGIVYTGVADVHESCHTYTGGESRWTHGHRIWDSGTPVDFYRTTYGIH